MIPLLTNPNAPRSTARSPLRSLLWGALALGAALAGMTPTDALATRVVVIQSDELPPYTDPVQPFLDALGEPADVFNLRGREKDAEALVERLKADPPEVVFALGAKAAWIVKRQTAIPVVYASILSPSRFDVEGRNVAGVAMVAAPGRSLGQLAAFFPSIKKLVVLRGPSIPDSRILEMTHVAESAGLTLDVRRVRTPKELRDALSDLGDADAAWLQADRAVLDKQTYIYVVEESRRRRMPLVVETENMVRAGGMFAVVPDADGVGQSAAKLVQTVLNGQKPEGEVIYADGVDVVLNLDTVQAAGVAFDTLMLDFVDIVVE